MPQTLILTTHHQNIILMIRIPMVVLIILVIRIIVIINFSLKTTASLFVDLSPLLSFPLTLLGLDSHQKLSLGYADPDPVEELIRIDIDLIHFDSCLMIRLMDFSWNRVQ